MFSAPLSADKRPSTVTNAAAQRKTKTTLAQQPVADQSSAPSRSHTLANNSPQVHQLRAIQDMANNSPVVSHQAGEVVQRFLLTGGSKRNPKYYSSFDPSKKLFADYDEADAHDRMLEAQSKAPASPTPAPATTSTATPVATAPAAATSAAPAPPGRALPQEVYSHIAGFLEPVDQARLSQVSKGAQRGVAATNPKLSGITSARRVGGIGMYLEGAGSTTNKVYSPMSSTGDTPAFPHLTVPQDGQPGSAHVTDINGMKLDRHRVKADGTLEGAEHIKPSRKTKLVPSADGTEHYRVQGHGTEPKPHDLLHPVSLTEDELLREDPDWSGKKVTSINDREGT